VRVGAGVGVSETEGASASREEGRVEAGQGQFKEVAAEKIFVLRHGSPPEEIYVSSFSSSPATFRKWRNKPIFND
jgi:hypothetical protein